MTNNDHKALIAAGLAYPVSKVALMEKSLVFLSKITAENRRYIAGSNPKLAQVAMDMEETFAATRKGQPNTTAPKVSPHLRAKLGKTLGLS